MVDKVSRKYISEFGIRAFSERVTICYPNDLETAKKQFPNHKYHIYIINKINRFKFHNFKIDESNDTITIEIEKGVFNKENIIIGPINLKPLLIGWDCDYESFKCFISEDSKTLFFSENIYNTTIGMSTLAFLADVELHQGVIPLEVLYVGQAFGKEGERDAFDRLDSHSTLQKISNDFLSNPLEIEYELAITLWEFVPFLDHTIDGREKSYLTSTAEEEEHFLKVMLDSDLGLNNQLINVTEAALINFFKPKYNIMFKNNFPDTAHKGYKQYYDLDFNAIQVELDPSCINVNMSSPTKKYNIYERITYNLESEEKRKSMFNLSLYDGK